MRFVAVNKARKPSPARPDSSGQDYKNLHRIADKLAPIIERKLRMNFKDFRDQVDVRDILNALDEGNPHRIEGLIPWGQLFEKYPDLKDDLHQAVVDAGFATDDQLRSLLVSTARVPTAELVFNRQNPEAIAWAEKRAGDLIDQITVDSREAVRTVIADTIRTGSGYGTFAQKIKDAVGLNAQGAGAVNRYRDGLLAQGVNQGMVDQRVDAYRERLLTARAETISRTETIAATNEGQQNYWDQLVEQDIIDPDTAKKVWVVTPDDRLCLICEPLDGVAVGLDEAFKTSVGEVDAPPAHPNCRCALSLDLK